MSPAMIYDLGTLIYAGTGHRLEVLGGYNESVEAKVLRHAQTVLKRLQPLKIVSGMALGWDTAITLAAIELGIPFIAAVPFEGQESVWSKEAQARYCEMLSKAESVHIVCEGGYATHKYHVRDKWMVDNSHKTLALWNGQTVGGTYSTVQYTKKSKGEEYLINTWDEWSLL
jgi:uncharacterized phage-like protein YoqJ